MAADALVPQLRTLQLPMPWLQMLLVVCSRGIYTTNCGEDDEYGSLLFSLTMKLPWQARAVWVGSS